MLYVFFLVLFFNIILFYLHGRQSLFFAQPVAKPQVAAKPQAVKPQVAVKPQAVKPQAVKPQVAAKPQSGNQAAAKPQSGNQAAAKPQSGKPPVVQSQSQSNPGFTAGANGMTWDKFAKINPNLAQDPKAKQQFQQGQAFAKIITDKPTGNGWGPPTVNPKSAYSAGNSGITWNQYVSQNPNVANIPGAQTLFNQGANDYTKAMLPGIYGAGKSGESWDSYKARASNLSNISNAQSTFIQGRNDFIKNVMSKDTTSQSAFAAGIQGIPWQQYIQKVPSAANIPGAQDLYKQGQDFGSHIVPGSSLNQYNNSVAIGGGFIAGVLPILLGLLL